MTAAVVSNPCTVGARCNCQDNELSWIDWDHADQDLQYFTVSVPAFRRAHPAFRRRQWCEGQALPGGGERDIAWFTPGGQEMSEQDWSAGFTKSLMMFLDGRFPASRGPWGRKFLMRLEP